MVAEKTAPRSVNLSEQELCEAVADFVAKRYGTAPGEWEAVIYIPDDVVYGTRYCFNWRRAEVPK